ncbi:MAG: hypothetical protein AB7S61_09735 [Methanoregulaceae archaeon]
MARGSGVEPEKSMPGELTPIIDQDVRSHPAVSRRLTADFIAWIRLSSRRHAGAIEILFDDVE